MSDLPNRLDLFTAFRRYVATTPNTRINPTIIDVAGSDLNLLAGGSSMMGEEVITALSDCMLGLWVESASSDALDRVAFDRYQIVRNSAVAATVDLTLFRVSGPSPVTYPAGSRVQTADGTQFATDTDVTLGIGVLSAAVGATALLTGPDSNVSAGAIIQFIDAPSDLTLQVTNDESAAGGSDAESDVQFRARILGFFPTVRRGTLGAIEYGAKQVPGVAVAKAIEITNPHTGDPASEVQLIIADVNGNASTAMIRKVQASLIYYRPCGIPVDVIGGSIQYVPVAWTLAYESGVDTLRKQQEIISTTVAVSQFLNPNDTLHRSTLIAAARNIAGVIVGQNALVTPAGDVVPATPDVILRVRPQDILFT